MEGIVKELKKIVPFKSTTSVGDIVLIAVENPKSVIYAIVVDIVRDDSRRDEWWHLTMNILSVPPQQVTWTLREPQFTGQEIFTMNDEGRYIQAVRMPDAPALTEKFQQPVKEEKKSSPKPSPVKTKKSSGNDGQKKSKKSSTVSKKTTLRVVK